MKKLLFLIVLMLYASLSFAAYTEFADGDIPSAATLKGNWTWGYWGNAIYDADTGGDDTYVVTLTPAPVAINAGMVIRFKVTTGNTGACTLDVNGTGAVAIKKNISDALQDGDIVTGDVVEVCFDGTNWILKGHYVNATTSVKGVASFSSDHFDVTAGAVTIKADGIDDTLIDFGTGAGQVSSDDITEGSTNKYVTSASVNSTALKTATGTLSGNASASIDSGNLAMNDYSFSPNYQSTNGFIHASTDAETDTAGRFKFQATSGNLGTYAVYWRYVNSSDLNHWIYLLVDKDTGEIKCVWEAPDHCPAKELHPFDNNTEDIIYVVDDKDIEDIRSHAEEDNVSVSKEILEYYEISKESSYKSRRIFDGKQMKDLISLPEKIRFCKIRRKQL